MDYRTAANVTLSPEQLIQFGLSLGMTPNQLKQALFSLSPDQAKTLESPNGTVFTLDVDYSLTKMAMIRAGNYGYVNDFIRNNDPKEGKISGTGTTSVQLELVHFNRVISTADALKEIKARGLVPAGIEHLLALGAKHPNLQKEFPIVALGSVWRFSGGRRFVACLDRWRGERGLDLGWDDYDWCEDCRFLVVGK